ncbi:MAG: glycosyltransferase family 4 protein, partial [Acidobacteriota bacterium]|nr:glycosyltransferase family 4 protein [Acidobacteriota bacterium]
SIHDLSFEHLPETFNRRSRAQLRFTVRRSARMAARVLALSEHARLDIISTYKIAPNRVTAIPIAAPTHFRPVEDEYELQRVRQIYGINGDYILSVSSIQPRKNLTRLLSAYERLRRTRPEGSLPQLVLVGKRAWLYRETLKAIEKLGTGVIVTGYVPETDLPALYSGALCFVYPSFFEGFGLPPLEAMKCGTPVITGDRTSLPEVVGDGGVLVNPFDIDAIASAIATMVDDSSFRSRLRIESLNRARIFDWRETARRTLEVYKQAADNVHSLASVAECAGP